MAEVITDPKALKLHGMAQAYVELLEQGGSVAMQTSQWLIEHLLEAEHTYQAMRTIAYQMHVARFPIHRDLASFGCRDVHAAAGRIRASDADSGRAEHQFR
ncbi:MAG TPA: ATP-binding protein [Rhodanobacter sp.]|nr:ATP-binding protein [Rhodanobacter sp.]